MNGRSGKALADQKREPLRRERYLIALPERRHQPFLLLTESLATNASEYRGLWTVTYFGR